MHGSGALHGSGADGVDDEDGFEAPECWKKEEETSWRKWLAVVRTAFKKLEAIMQQENSKGNDAANQDDLENVKENFNEKQNQKLGK